MIKHDTAVSRLAELGHDTRLHIYRLLIKAGPSGCPVGELQKHLAIPASTLSHHLSRLINAELIYQKREGRTLFCHASYSALDELTQFLTAKCCTTTQSNCQQGDNNVND